jgi:hypothetical protein
MTASPDSNLKGKTAVTVKSGRSPGGATVTAAKAKTTGNKGAPYTAVVTGNFSFAGVDQGIDFTGNFTIHALDDCVITHYDTHSGWPGPNGSAGTVIVYRMTAGPKKGNYVYNAEAVKAVNGLKEGSTYSKGDAIATVSSSYPGCEIGWATAAGLPLAPRPAPRPAPQYTADGADFQKFVLSGDSAGGSAGSSGGGTSGSSSGGSTAGLNSDDVNAAARAAALSTFIQLPGIFNTFESRALAGQKSLMNDQPLLPFVEQLAQASLRNFMSMPNGNFYAFFPDYFGGLNHRTPYWEIDDVEILDGSIDLSDDALATHVYMTGDVVGFDGVVTKPGDGSGRPSDWLFSSGVVTIFEAFAADFLTGIGQDSSASTNPPKGGTAGPKSTVTPPDGAQLLKDKTQALNFLQKYGARPYQEDAPMVRSPFFELFLSYQKFMLLWSQQFLTTFTFTFMPELYPGGIVAFPNHGIQCYVAEVNHNFDFETGFTTEANLMAPASLPGASRQNVHEGMIRAFSLGDDLPFDPFTDARKKRKDGKGVKQIGGK